MTKKEMARAIAGELGLTQLQAQEVVQRVFDGITETLVQEGRIELRNFGIFEVRKRKPRKARNPRTGEELKVPASKYSPNPFRVAVSPIIATPGPRPERVRRLFTPAKMVITFKPGREMEVRVGQLKTLPNRKK